MAPVEDTALGEKGKNASFAIQGTILFFYLVWSFSLSIITRLTTVSIEAFMLYISIS